MTMPAKPTAEEPPVKAGAQQIATSRWVAILYIAFCFEIGLFLFVFPWVPFWHHNYFMGRYPWILAMSQNYYVRGAISGLGLVDIFLAIHEVWRMREALGLVPPSTAR